TRADAASAPAARRDDAQQGRLPPVQHLRAPRLLDPALQLPRCRTLAGDILPRGGRAFGCGSSPRLDAVGQSGCTGRLDRRLLLRCLDRNAVADAPARDQRLPVESEEHTSELQSRENIVCRLLLEKKNETKNLYH